MSHNISKSPKNVSSVEPCGNPKRYGSRDVVRMQHGVKRCHNMKEEEETGTEGEKYIKTLVRQQTKKDMTVSEHFSQQREFTPATSHAPEVEKLVGVHEYSEYRQVEALDSQIEDLRHCGLTDEEIAMKLADNMEMDCKAPGYGTQPSVYQSRLEEIRVKVAAKHRILSQPDRFKGALELTRREKEVDEAQRQRHGTGPPTIVTIQKSFAESHPDDPVNHIGEIMSQLEGKVERESRRDRRRRRQMNRKKKYYDQFIEVVQGCEERPKKNKESTDDDSDSDETDTTIGSYVYGSWTSVESEKLNPASESISDRCPDEKPFLLHPQSLLHSSICNQSDSKNKVSVREIPVEIPFLTECEISDNCLSLEEIKSMDKFKNYDPGSPSKVVYVKNLPHDTTDQDLLALFGNFQKTKMPKITFRLLTGRMKGQAFVTFPETETATKAINLINGYKMKNKPVILCFGKQQS